MLKKFLSVSLVLSLTMALIMVSPTAPETYSAQASCIGCTENVITTVQLQALLAAEDNTAVGHVVASTAFQGISNRLSGNTKFRVSSVGEGTYVVAFEVLPLNHADPGVFFFYHELAVFVVQNGVVVKATVNSRVAEDNHLFFQRDLLSQGIVAIRTTEPMPSFVPPKEIAPAEFAYTGALCFICVEWLYVPGQYDFECRDNGQTACSAMALALSWKGPVAAGYYLACITFVRLMCWIPGRTVCINGFWSDNCLTEFRSREGSE